MRSHDWPRRGAAELDPKSAGLLLDAALNATPVDPPPTPEKFGEYELLRQIGRGSSGTVYEARDRGGRLVALKRMDGPLAPEAVRRFRQEAELTRSLKHPNIVRVLVIGEHAGRPFFTMQLLHRTLKDASLPAAESAVLMAKIARAVHHAHTQAPGMLHRDLKPANILLEADGTPYVADFGLARRLDQDATTGQGTMAGTLDYMAPEQALGAPGELTPAADVYSLGVIFYELLTGDVPVRGATVREFLQRLWSAEPVVPPRKIEPGVGRGCQTVCLQCLENDPARRYASAAELADDLERARAGRPTRARPPSLLLRAARWIRRHPRGAAGMTGAAMLALAALAAMVLAWRAQERAAERVLDTNAFIASGQAGAVLFQLREYGDRVEAATRDPYVHAVLAEGSFHVPAPELASRLGGFDSFFVMSDEGRILAQWPSAAPPVYERRFTFRDYFRGARYLADTGTAGAYVARAFRSESHGLLEFGISAPVMDRGRQIGLVVGTLSAKSAFGAVRMEDSPQSGPIITTLVGPRGNDRAAGPDAPAPSDFTFLVHPGMGRGAAHALAAPSPSALRAAFGLSAPPGQQFSLQYVRALQLRSYRDPVPGFDGEWLAALAPVGKTGYLVLVQTRKSAALAWLRPSSPLRAASAGAALLLTCAVGLGIGRWRARSNRRDRPAPTRRPRRPPTGNEAREQLVTGEDHAITPCAGSATRARSR